jgi:hypothetical protein
MGSMSAKRVSLRQVGKQLIVTERPKQRQKSTPKAEKARERFLDAAFYAKNQGEDPTSKAFYEPGITEKKRSVYAVALNDYLVAPKVDFIKTVDYKGRVGDALAIRAKDDFRVVRVKIEIFDASGALLEEGDAVTDDSARYLWSYSAQALNPAVSGTTIRATAFDKPGNTGTLEQVI